MIKLCINDQLSIIQNDKNDRQWLVMENNYIDQWLLIREEFL